MAQLLTSDERIEYDVRYSPAADSLRATLWYFKPSENEFRSLVQAHKAFDDHIRNERLSGIVPDEQLPEDYPSSWKQMEEQVRSSLGEERFKQYQMSGDGIYRQALKFTEQNNLAAEAAANLYQIRYDLADAYKTGIIDPELEGAAREAKLHELRQTAETRLLSVLGETGYQAYRASQFADWVEKIEQGFVPAKLRP